MPLRLNVGLQKKVGLPDYGSLGASCHVEVELDGSIIERDLDAFHRHVQNAFAACRQAVQDELARNAGEQRGGNGTAHGGNGSPSNGTPAPHDGRQTNGNGGNAGNGAATSFGRRATRSQVRALHAIATRQRFDLAAELQQRFGVSRAEDLALKQASEAIQAFNTVGSGSQA
jgi:hypothetical protein